MSDTKGPHRSRWGIWVAIGTGAAALLTFLNELPALFERTLPWLARGIPVGDLEVELWQLLLALVALVAVAALAVEGVRSRRARASVTGSASPPSSTSSTPAVPAPLITTAQPPAQIPAPSPAPSLAVGPASASTARADLLRSGAALVEELTRQEGRDPTMDARAAAWLAEVERAADRIAPGGGERVRRLVEEERRRREPGRYVIEYSFYSPDGGATSEVAQDRMRVAMAKRYGSGLPIQWYKVVTGHRLPGHNVRVRVRFDDRPPGSRARKPFEPDLVPELPPDLPAVRAVHEWLAAGAPSG